jgi:site-specific DNA-cytosine methylase
VVRRAFAEKGHEVWSCDLLPAEDGDPRHLIGDALEVLRDGAPWDMMIAHPPCTHLSLATNPSRARKDPEEIEAAVRFARELILTRDAVRVCVENPRGILSTRVMPPEQEIQPWWFGDPVRKRTALWLRRLPRLRRTLEVEPWDWGWWSRGGNKIRGHLRSRTFDGVARAMADQWG